jgi:hypothetical protein
MRIVKNMNKVKLFLLGLTLAFSVAACESCNNKGGKVTVKPGEEKELTFKATKKIDKIEDAMIVAPSFEQHNQKVSVSGNNLTGQVEKDKEFKLKLKVKGDAKKGDSTVEIKAGNDLVAKLTVTIEEK